MSLPRNGTSWPPHDAHTEAMAEWSAWYSGDPTQLGTFYGSRSGVENRPSQLRTGVVGRLARWWWGQPTADGEQSAKLHVPLAADICSTSADLLFSEQVKLGSESDSMAAFLTELQDNGLDTKLHEGAEVGAALGGTYLRTVWDSEVSPLPWTEVSHPDGALPEFRHGRLRAVSLWSELAPLDNSTVWRLIERHERGAIEYGLYAGTKTNLGKLHPLQDHPDTADLAPMVDENGIQVTGVDRLLVTYVPNMLPNRLHRTSPQGRSDLQGVTPFLDALDEAYSSWWRDIRHAKARIHVPAQYLDSNGPGQGASLNMDREVYVPIEGVMAKGDDGLLLNVQQFAIRVNEHAETCRAWTERIIESAGYSTNTLSSDGGGAMTATEVHAKNRRSFMTRGKKVRYWTAALQDHLLTQAEVAKAHLHNAIDVDTVHVEFSDGVQESAQALAQTVLALRNAEAASARTRVQMVNPDWDETKVDAEVSAILSETGHGADTLDDPTDAGL
jgi:A118 family predicted phage portal protein